MTAEAAAELAAEVAALPAWTLDERQLGDTELLLSGAFAPLTGFMGEAKVASVRQRGVLPGGAPWPVPITLEVRASALPESARRLALCDPEGVPIAVLDIRERTPEPDMAAPAGNAGRHARPGLGGGVPMIRVSGPVTGFRPPEHGAFRRLRRTPAEVRAELGGDPVLAFATRRPMSGREIGQLRHFAGQLRARLLLLPLVAGPTEVVGRPEALVRTVIAAARHLPAGTLVVPVPLAPHDGGPGAEVALHAVVAAAYGATQLLADDAEGHRDGRDRGHGPAAQTVIPVVGAGSWAYDRSAEVWRPLGLIEPGTETDLAAGELEDLLDRGEKVPGWFAPESVAAELRRARPPRRERGLVIFFTGLSGSGKSTIARALRDALAERGDRTVSLLDGDSVRQLLSAGLTFSRADRDLNIARIGYVAAEVARHGGIAICAPIAPYAGARAQVRRMISETGDFLLIHVSTPVEVCEARDRKGLYAKARAGLIGNFTGVSDPYEEPRDADLILDTSEMSKQEAADAVLGLLVKGGWLAPPGQR